MAAKSAVQEKDKDQLDLIEKIDDQAQPENIDQEVEIQLDEKVEQESKPDEATLKLQKLLEDTRKSEEIQKTRAEKYRQEAEENRKAAEASRAEVGKTRKDAIQAQYDAVTTALTANTNEVEAAKRDIKAALAMQDYDAQTEATDRLMTARANIAKLEDSKNDLEFRIKNPEPEPQPVVKTPARVTRWIKEHQELMQDPDIVADLQYLHRKAMKAGIEVDSDEYIEFIETGAGLKKAEDKVEPEKAAEKPAQKPAIVSAPVSREGTNLNGGGGQTSVRLTPQQREAAKIAGVSEKDYAENLLKINKMKANGTYGG